MSEMTWKTFRISFEFAFYIFGLFWLTYHAFEFNKLNVNLMPWMTTFYFFLYVEIVWLLGFTLPDIKSIKTYYFWGCLVSSFLIIVFNFIFQHFATAYFLRAEALFFVHILQLITISFNPNDYSTLPKAESWKVELEHASFWYPLLVLFVVIIAFAMGMTDNLASFTLYFFTFVSFWMCLIAFQSQKTEKQLRLSIFLKHVFVAMVGLFSMFAEVHLFVVPLTTEVYRGYVIFVVSLIPLIPLFSLQNVITNKEELSV